MSFKEQNSEGIKRNFQTTREYFTFHMGSSKLINCSSDICPSC
jgi:hypothetical protein